MDRIQRALKKSDSAKAVPERKEATSKKSNLNNRTFNLTDPIFERLGHALMTIQFKEGRKQRSISMSVIVEAALTEFLNLPEDEMRERLRPYERQGAK